MGACEGDWGMGMDGVVRDGDIARPGEADDKREGEEPRGRLYGSKRSSWAVSQLCASYLYGLADPCVCRDGPLLSRRWTLGTASYQDW